jgi:hypothetical protein
MLAPVKGASTLPTKHSAAFVVPKTPSAIWQVESAVASMIEPRRLELPSELHDAGSVCKQVPSGEAPSTAQTRLLRTAAAGADKVATTGAEVNAMEPEGMAVMSVACCGTCTMTVPIPPTTLGVATVNVAIVEPGVV